MNLQRMIVIPDHTFEKWKNIVLDDEKMSNLDKNMKSILNNTKLNDITKWQLQCASSSKSRTIKLQLPLKV